jgi:hypothetical protein
MTPKEKVLGVYPKAQAFTLSTGETRIIIDSTGAVAGNSILSEEHAWMNAAFLIFENNVEPLAPNWFGALRVYVCEKCGQPFEFHLEKVGSPTYCETCFLQKVEPRDANGTLLAVGDTVLFPVARGGKGNAPIIRFGRIVKIGEPEHRGYGYQTRTLNIRPQDGESDKLVKYNYPGNCLFANQFGAPNAPENVFAVRLDEHTNE